MTIDEIKSGYVEMGVINLSIENEFMAYEGIRYMEMEEEMGEE